MSKPYAKRTFKGEYHYVDNKNVLINLGVVIIATQHTATSDWIIEFSCVGLATFKEEPFFVKNQSSKKAWEDSVSEAIFKFLFTKRPRHPDNIRLVVRGSWQ